MFQVARTNSMQDDILALAMESAQAGGRVLAHYAGNAEVRFKSDLTHNLVTQADVEAEAEIVKMIRDRFGSHEILGEEGNDPSVDLNHEHLWIIDPLDGTTNFAHGLPQFCTAVGYASRGQMQVAAIWDPCRAEMFHATRGGGACLNGTPISVSSNDSLSKSVIATGFYYDRGELMRRTLTSIEKLFAANIRGIRRLGSAALDQCWVACGRLEAFFEYQLSPWDYAAASLIVEEAGGRCMDRAGRPLELNSESIVACNPSICDELVDVVRYG